MTRGKGTSEEGYIHTHTGDDPYVHVKKMMVNDRRLSWDTVGLLTYLMGKPNDWKVRMQQLIAFRSAGRDAMRRMLKEAAACGYVYRERKHAAKGRFVWVTHVYATPDLNPHFTQPSTDLPSVVEPSTVEPSTANPSPYQLPILPIPDVTNEREHKTAAAALPSSFVKEDRAAVRSARADQRLVAETETADIWRGAAHLFGRRTFNAGEFRDMAGYIDRLSPAQLRTFCAYCFITDEKTARGDTDIDDYVAFVCGSTNKAANPGFGEAARLRFESVFQSTLNQLERDTWEDSPESEFVL